MKQNLLITGTVAYSTFVGVRISLLINSRHFAKQPVLKSQKLNPLMHTSTVILMTCFQALPQIIIKRLAVSSSSAQAFCRSVLPVPLSGQ